MTESVNKFIKTEVAAGIAVADILYHVTQVPFVPGIFSVFRHAAQHAAEDPTEVLMTSIAQKTPAVRKHSYEGRKVPQVHQIPKLLFHAAPVIVEPPGTAQLDAAGNIAVRLEGAHNGTDDPVVGGVQGIEDGAGQSIFFFQQIQQSRQTPGIGNIIHGVKAGVRAQTGEHFGRIIPDAAKVQLHDPAFLRIGPGTGEQQIRMESLVGFFGHGFAPFALLQGLIERAFGGMHAEHAVQRMVADPAAVGFEVIYTGKQRPAQILHGVDGEADYLLQTPDIGGKGGLVYPHGLIRTEGGERCLQFAQLPDVERYSRMYYDLSINIEGIDAIHHLLERMESMQQEIYSLHSRLRLFEDVSR